MTILATLGFKLLVVIWDNLWFSWLESPYFKDGCMVTGNELS